MSGTLNIFYERTLVAEVVPEPQLQLRYAASWLARRAAFPISLSMPLETGPHPADLVLPWLANLLPESHLTEIGQQLRVSPQDVIGILTAIGRDTAGALSIAEPRAQTSDWRKIDGERELERIIEELPAKPFLVGERGVSMSLAGVQEKLPVALIDGELYIPLDGTPSTHILKPDSRNLRASVQNEAYCLTLARICGLPAPRIDTGTAGGRQYLLVERFDRMASESGVFRLHQEDFCQILGRFPSEKYERGALGRPTGTTLAAMFDAIKRLSTPGQRLPLLDGVIFNVLACNTDSHAKNYSMLIGAGGTAKMAPLYDILCAKVYPRVDQALPQNINGKTNADELGERDWEAFALQVGLSPAATVERVIALSEAAMAKAEEAVAIVEGMPAGGHEVLGAIAKAVVKRAARIRRQAGPTGPGSPTRTRR